MSHGNQTFATVLNCMDGRTQISANEYVKKKFGVDYVDTITEAGIDGALAKTLKRSELYEATKRKILISVEKHGSFGIVIVGHSDCAGNPVEKEQHIKDIRESVLKVKEMIFPKEISVEGIYIELSPEVRIEEVK